MRATRARAALIAMLNNTHADLADRDAAAEALAVFRNPRALAPLHAALADPNALLRQNAMEALVSFHDNSARQPLEQTLATNTDANRRATAAQLLGQLGNGNAIPALRKALHDPDAGVR